MEWADNKKKYKKLFVIVKKHYLCPKIYQRN